MSTAIQKRYIEMLKQLILHYTKDHSVKVLLFGSHAKGNAHRHSDIDIGIWSATPLPIGFISHLKEKIEQSTIPYAVDVIDLSMTDEVFRTKVLNEGVIWKD